MQPAETLWYQRTGLWVLLGAVLTPLNLAVAIVLWDTFPRDSAIGLYAVASLYIAPACLWVGALVAHGQGARWTLVFSTGLLLVVAGSVAAFFYMRGLAYDALLGCERVLLPDGREGVRDPVRCDSIIDGTFERWRARTYGILRLFWLALLVVPFVLRRRFQSEGRRNTPTKGVAVAGWGLVALGGIALALMVSIGALDRGSVVEISVSIGTYVVVPVTAGVLLAVNRRRSLARMAVDTVPDNSA